MAKKHWPFLVGASVLGLVAGVLAKKKSPTEKAEWLKIYQGTWTYQNPNQVTNHTLTIDEQLQLFLDQRLIKGNIRKLTPEELVLQDEFGFHLKLTTDGAKLVNLYDEADDIIYPLKKAN